MKDSSLNVPKTHDLFDAANDDINKILDKEQAAPEEDEQAAEDKEDDNTSIVDKLEMKIRSKEYSEHLK